MEKEFDNGVYLNFYGCSTAFMNCFYAVKPCMKKETVQNITLHNNEI